MRQPLFLFQQPYRAEVSFCAWGGTATVFAAGAAGCRGDDIVPVIPVVLGVRGLPPAVDDSPDDVLLGICEIVHGGQPRIRFFL